jgi:NDP-hexose 2,3-enoyl reductase
MIIMAMPNPASRPQWTAGVPARAGTSSTIIGPRTVEQLTASERAAEMPLDDAPLHRLDEIWPGPGIAPQAYAW